MPGDFLLSYKILALKALIGWLGAWGGPLSVYAALGRPVGREIIAPSPLPSTSQRAVHTSGSEIPLGHPVGQRVALTFDLGPWADAEIAGDILGVLEKNGVTATLFFSGKFVERHPEVVAKAAASGHQLANHTYSHPDLTKTSPEAIVEELEKTQSLLEKAAGHTISPRYFRPPYGASNAKVLKAAESAGFHSVLWTVEALDWQKGATVEKVVERVLKKAKDGAIILMHITKVTQQTLPLILEKLPAQGYEFVTAEEILGEEAG